MGSNIYARPGVYVTLDITTIPPNPFVSCRGLGVYVTPPGVYVTLESPYGDSRVTYTPGGVTYTPSPLQETKGLGGMVVISRVTYTPGLAYMLLPIFAAKAHLYPVDVVNEKKRKEKKRNKEFRVMWGEGARARFARGLPCVNAQKPT